MRTEYVFSVDTAELVYIREITGSYIYTVNHRDEFGVRQLVSMFVCEDDDAEREFFNHFGDDSSWPPGWWAKMVTPLKLDYCTHSVQDRPYFTRASWAAENYPPSKVSWQEYFGVKSP